MSRLVNKLKHEILRYKVIFHKFRYGLNNIPRKEKIIISMTTFPKRFENIDLCIKSLLLQTMKPDKIIIWLGSDSDEFMISKYLRKYEKYGITIFVDSDLNIKSHKKYYYALNNYPNDIIITVDDDLIYPFDMVESLYNMYLKYPKCIVGRRVHKITFENNKISKYNNWITECNDTLIPSNQLFITTGAGTLFPPYLKKDDLLNVELMMKYAPTADDVWINLISIKNNVKRVWAPNNLQMPTTIKKSQHFSLVKKNVEENYNDIYIEKIVNDFNIKIDLVKK